MDVVAPDRPGETAARWQPLPLPLAWRERVLGLGARRLPCGPVDVDGVRFAARLWDRASTTKTRRRLAALAREVTGLDGETFGPAPHRAILWSSSDGHVSFRCVLPDGGAVDRMWSLADGRLAAVGLHSMDSPAREVVEPLLHRAADLMWERVSL